MLVTSFPVQILESLIMYSVIEDFKGEAIPFPVTLWRQCQGPLRLESRWQSLAKVQQQVQAHAGNASGSTDDSEVPPPLVFCEQTVDTKVCTIGHAQCHIISVTLNIPTNILQWTNNECHKRANTICHVQSS